MTNRDDTAHLTQHITLTAHELSALRTGQHAVPVASAVYRIEGSGAIACIQGVLTNDVVKRSRDALVWGAVLTPKGMIIFDAWVMRDGDAAAWIIVPGGTREVASTLFKRTFPPRIAKVTDRTDDRSVWWLLGGDQEAVTAAAGTVPAGPAPFTGLVLGDPSTAESLANAGWADASPAWADASKLLTGWPTLGREIDDKTLPQEVRFDELDGVRYDKGCYTGQETVARLHYRGHANRTLRGVRFDDDVEFTGAPLTVNGKDVGHVSTIARIGTASIGLAKIRREVGEGAVVNSGEAIGRVVSLPFEMP